MIKNLIKNWATTSAGIISIAGGILGLIRGINMYDETVIIASITAILTGIGVMFSKQQNVTGVGDDARTQKEIEKGE